jgi:hypothetical protein
VKITFLCALVLLSACASQPTGPYSRVDGRPADPNQMRAVLAQCRGEGAVAVGDYVTGEGAIPWAVGTFSRSSKESAVVNACMARNGYLGQ